MNIKWLEDLNSSLWVRMVGVYKQVTENNDYTITDAELEKVMGIIVAEKLLCTPNTGAFGFGYRLDVWRPAGVPVYPGTEGEFKPTHIISISDRHMCKLWKDLPNRSDVKDRFWTKIIEPLVYNRCSNVRAVEAKFGPLKDRSYYEY